MKLKMVIRPVLFCLLCAASLALVSGLIKDIATKWNQHLLLIITICIVFCLTLLFGKWEKYTSKDIGIKLSKTGIKMIITGFWNWPSHDSTLTFNPNIIRPLQIILQVNIFFISYILLLFTLYSCGSP